MTNFDVILGMDMLAKYQAQLDCPKQNITLRGPKKEQVINKGKVLRCGVKLVTTIEAQKLLGQGCKGFLHYVVDTKTP